MVAVVLASCGSDEGGTTGQGTKVEGAKTLDPAKVEAAKGDVTWCIGKDTTGAYKKSVAAYNKSQSNVKAKLLELPESADEQRTQLIQRLRAKSDECDVVGMDVVWTAEFAGQKWLYDLTSALESRKSEFIPSTLETATFDDKIFGAPYNTNAGFIYYRTDKGLKAPSSWEEVYSSAKDKGGFGYMGADYEGLTVSFLELLYSAGGSAISEDGSKSAVNSDVVAKEVLTFMADGVEDGAVPKAVTTYMEEENRRAFESGQITQMRNWPYAIALGNESKIKGKFKFATFPSYKGGEPSGVLGGFNLGISAFSKNPEAAMSFANFLSGEMGQRFQAQTATPPVLESAYEDAATKKTLPAKQLRKAIAQAKPRPVSPVYPQITEAIHKNVHAALTGDAEPDAAIEKMSEDIDKAINTF